MTFNGEKGKTEYKRETILKDISPPQKTTYEHTDIHIPMLLHGQKFFYPIMSSKDVSLHYFSKYSLSY